MDVYLDPRRSLADKKSMCFLHAAKRFDAIRPSLSSHRGSPAMKFRLNVAGMLRSGQSKFSTYSAGEIKNPTLLEVGSRYATIVWRRVKKAFGSGSAGQVSPEFEQMVENNDHNH